MMENSTPLTRCDTCHTVFEVPTAILDSVDSRVRCGECLQVFDASINLHTASRPDFSLVDETLVDGSTESESSKSAVAATTDAATTAAATTAAATAAAATAAALNSTDSRKVGSAVLDLETATAGAAENTQSASVANTAPDKPSDGIVTVSYTHLTLPTTPYV